MTWTPTEQQRDWLFMARRGFTIEERADSFSMNQLLSKGYMQRGIMGNFFMAPKQGDRIWRLLEETKPGARDGLYTTFKNLPVVKVKRAKTAEKYHLTADGKKTLCNSNSGPRVKHNDFAFLSQLCKNCGFLAQEPK